VRPRGNDISFVNKLNAINKDSGYLVQDKFFRDYEFGIEHYAGPVVYDATNFVKKNMDTLPGDLQTRALPHIQYSHVSLMDKDKGKAASEFRTSQSALLPSHNDVMFQAIDRRVASVTRLARNHQEQTQVLRYGFSGAYVWRYILISIRRLVVVTVKNSIKS
jgi:hypothetical protein